MTSARLQVGVMILGVLAVASCGSGKKGVLPQGVGYCETTCSKSCGQDSDCDTSRGELCCDYGDAGKSCAQASQCPIACSDDSACNTMSGQACVRVDLSIPQKYCEAPSAAIQLCQGDNDCTNGNVCCNIYNESVCLPPTSCPKSCTDSSACDTANSEICCTTLGAVEPALKAPGLCLNPASTPCPKACSTSQDCAATGDICCNGICQATCRQTCMQSSDCNQQICCKSAEVRIPPPTKIFSTGPHCTGTPMYTCAQCQSAGYCSQGYCPGCTATCTGTAAYTCAQCQSAGYCSQGYCPGCTNSSTGTCSGTPSYSCATCGSLGYCGTTYCPGCTMSGTGTCTGTPYSCADCGTLGYCGTSYCPGCTNSGTGSCTGSRIYSCSTFNTSYMSYCVATPGCTWNASTLICSGTPQACNAITSQTTCSSQLDCSWSTTGTCTGTTTTSCASLNSSTSCGGQLGCSWTAAACGGTPTACAALNSTTCSTQPGCTYNATSCTGTPTACAQLTTATSCSKQPGCAVGACSGNPSPCASLSLTDCTKQPGCTVAN